MNPLKKIFLLFGLLLVIGCGVLIMFFAPAALVARNTWSAIAAFNVKDYVPPILVRTIGYEKGTTTSPSLEIPDIEPILTSTSSTSSLKQIIGLVTERLPTSTDKMVIADLAQMKIFLIEHGTTTSVIDIKSKGRPGTPWQTPIGIYNVQAKEDEHFSSIGHVWMPDSIHFFGNFFIHGWPYYGDGTPVPEGYSGGCIRLATEDSQIVYDFVKKGTPIVVRDNKISTSTSYLYDESFVKNVDRKIAGMNLDVDSYLIADIDSGAVIAEKNAKATLPIGDITKLMTSLVSLEFTSLYKELTLPYLDDIRQESTETLRSGDVIENGDAQVPLLYEGSDLLAETMARVHGKSYFIKQMNLKAEAIGLNDTYFADPAGFASSTVSTAEDIFIFAHFIAHHKPYLFETTSFSEKTTKEIIWNNKIPFASDPKFLGGMVELHSNNFSHFRGGGVTLYTLPLSEFENRRIVIVVLGAKNPAPTIQIMVDVLVGERKILPE